MKRWASCTLNSLLSVLALEPDTSYYLRSRAEVKLLVSDPI
jgi:hypothetical protein